MTCPADCGACAGTCGDGTCDSTEDCNSCPADCGPCTTGGCHDVCSVGAGLDPSCDPCAAFVCVYVDFTCCLTAWTADCVDDANTFCAFCY